MGNWKGWSRDFRVTVKWSMIGRASSRRPRRHHACFSREQSTFEPCLASCEGDAVRGPALWCTYKTRIYTVKKHFIYFFKNSHSWRSKAPSSTFSPNLRRRSPSRSRSRARLRPRRTCLPPCRSLTRLPKSRLSRQLNRNRRRRAAVNQKATRNLRKRDSPSYLATRPRQPNQSMSALILSWGGRCNFWQRVIVVIASCRR